MVVKQVSTKKISLKIRFELDDNLPLNKTLRSHMLSVIVRSSFEEDIKYYPETFLDECLDELQKCNTK